MHLLLVDSRIQEKDLFLTSVKSDVVALEYDYERDTYASILERCTNKPYETVGFVFHEQRNVFQFVRKEIPCILSQKKCQPFVQFLKDLQTYVFDFIACRLFHHEEWRQLFEEWETQYGWNIHASVDVTGNPSSSGNWIMESDNINIQPLYFTDKIELYNGTLALTGSFFSDTFGGIPPLSGSVYAVAYDSISNILYVGGSFLSAGSVPNTSYIAALNQNTQTWYALSTGLDGICLAIEIASNGLVYVGGNFLSAGGTQNTSWISVWNPSTQTWSALGTGINSPCRAIAIASNGLVYVGGEFTNAGNVPNTFCIAIWNPTAQTWYALGTGLNGPCNTIAISTEGLVYAGGFFTNAGTVSNTSYIAVWNPIDSTWSSVGAGLNDWCFAIAIAPNGLVYVGGMFTSVGSKIAVWDPINSIWSPLGIGIDGFCATIAVAQNGLIYVGGEFISMGNIAVWNPINSSWSALGNGLNGICNVVTVSSNTVYVGGNFTSAGDFQYRNIASWAATTWSPLKSVTYPINDTGNVLEINDTHIYVGGFFVFGDAHYIYQLNRTTFVWSALGGGLDGVCNAIKTASDGLVYVGGNFLSAEGIPNTTRIAIWNPTTQTWSGLGGGLNDICLAIAVAANGLVYVGGFFTSADGVPNTSRIAVWNPTAQIWSALGGGLNGTCRTIAIASNGYVYAGGDFTSADGVQNTSRIAVWNPITNIWSALGDGLNGSCYTIAITTDGLVYAGGMFTSAGGVPNTSRIAVWNPTAQTWSALGNGLANTCTTIATAFDGFVYVGSSFGISVWNPSQQSWESFPGTIYGSIQNICISHRYVGYVGNFLESYGNNSNTTAFFNVFLKDQIPPIFSYPSAILFQNTSISIQPSHQYADILWSCTPSLPSGLVFNTSTGEITGASTILLSPTTFTVTATHEENGSYSSSFVLEVLPVPSYMPQICTVGIYTEIVPTNGIDAIWSSGCPSFPTGLHINPHTGVLSGVPVIPNPSTLYPVYCTILMNQFTIYIDITIQSSAIISELAQPPFRWAHWFQSLSATGRADGFTVRTDSLGYVYIAGSGIFTDKYIFNGIQSSIGFITQNNSGFILKLTPTGDLVWITWIDGKGNETLYDIIVDSSFHVYVTGRSQSGWSGIGNNLVRIGNKIVEKPFFKDVEADPDVTAYVVKLDPTGNFEWVNWIDMIWASGTMSGYDSGLALTLDSDENPVTLSYGESINGPIFIPSQHIRFQNNTSFSSTIYTVLTEYPGFPGGTVLYATKFNPSGQVQSIAGLTSYTYRANEQSMANIVIDQMNHFYVTSHFNPFVGPYIFGNTPLTFPVSVDTRSGFVAKFLSSGVYQWSSWITNNTTSNVQTEAKGSALLTNGDLFMTGYSYISSMSVAILYHSPTSSTITYISKPSTFENTTSVFLSKIDITGTHQWTKWLYGDGNLFVNDIQSDSSNLYISGTTDIRTPSLFWNTSTITKPYTSTGQASFLLKVDSCGEYQWMKWMYGRTNSDTYINQTTVQSNSLFAVGFTTDSESIFFQNSTQTTKPIKTNISELFVAKYAYNPPINVTATQTDGVAVLTWTPVDSNVFYNVYISSTTKPFELAGETAFTSFDLNLSTATDRYFFTVRSTDGTGTFSDPAPTDFIDAIRPPIVKQIGTTQIQIEWSTITNVSPYYVYRDGTKIGEISIGRFIDIIPIGTITDRIPAFYQITTSSNGQDKSGYGLLLYPPYDITSVVFESGIQFSWNSNMPFVSSYNIYKDFIFYSSIVDTTFLDTVVNTNSTYTYNISANYNDGIFVGEGPTATLEKVYLPKLSSITVFNSSIGIQLQWETNPVATFYTLYKNESFLQTVTSNSYLDIDVTPFSLIPDIYQISAGTDTSEGPLSQPVGQNFIPLTSNLQTSNTIHGTYIQWGLFPEHIVEFYLYRSTPFQVVSTFGSSHLDLAVIGGSSYTYSIYAKYFSYISDKADIPSIYLEPPILSCSNLEGGILCQWNSVPGATTYTLLRNGLFLTTTSELSYVDTYPINFPFIVFSYSIYAVTDSTESAQLPPISHAFIPSATNVVLTYNPDNMELTWDPVSGVVYKLYRNGYLYSTLTSTKFNDFDVISGYFYQYSLILEQSVFDSAPIIRHGFFVSPPLALQTRLSSVGIRLDWINGPTGPTGSWFPPGYTGYTGPTGPTGITDYPVYQDNVMTYFAETSSFFVSNLTTGNVYTYTVSARIGMYESAVSTFAQKLFLIPPIPSAIFGISSIGLSWSPIPGAVGYNVYKEGIPIFSTTETVYTDDHTDDLSTYTYNVATYDTDDQTPLSDPFSLRFLEPPRIQNLSDGIQVSMTEFSNLSYELFRNGNKYVTTNESIIIDTNIVPGAFYSYAYQITGIPEQVHLSAESTIQYLSQIPSLSLVNSKSDDSFFTAISWPSIPGASEYLVETSTIGLFSTYIVTTSSFQDIQVINDRQTTYHVQPRSGPYSGVFSDAYTNRYLTAPIPANVSTSIFLSWPDSSGALEFYIYRNDEQIQICTTTNTFFQDTNVTSGQFYTYRRSYLTSNGLTPFSAPSTILYLSPPFSPTAVNEQSTIRVSWTSPGTSFAIYRNGIFQTQHPTTVYYDSSIVHGDLYSYFIRQTHPLSISDESSTIRVRYLTPLSTYNSGYTIQLGLSTFPGLNTFTLFKNNTFFSTVTYADALATNPLTDDAVVSGSFYQYSYIVVAPGDVFTQSADSILYHLGAPQSFTAVKSADGQTVDMTWITDPCCTFYHIYRNNVRIAVVTGSSYTDTTVYNGTLYIYHVRSALNGYESGPSNEVELMFYQDPLLSNYGLRVRLDWNPVVGAAEYQISTSQWITTIPNGFSTITYKDSLVTSGNLYTYWVNVRYPTETMFETMGSNQIEFIAYPQVFQYNRWGTNNVTFTWDGIPGAQSYLLYVSSPAGQTYSYAVSTAQYVMTNPNTIYTFQLEAYGQTDRSSKSDIHWIFNSPPTRQFYPLPVWKTERVSLDVSGSPVHVVGPDGNLYFVISSRESSLATGITLGSMSPSGTLLWTFRHPNIYTGYGDGAPALVFGISGELYVAFVTTGHVPDRWNMMDVINLCGSCGDMSGRKDIVITRMDGVLQGTPVITWRIQDANINSCSDENHPFLLYDSAFQRLLVAYQCTRSILCGNNVVSSTTGYTMDWIVQRKSTIGSPTVVVSGFDLSGHRLWTYQDDTLNGPGENTTPQITVDKTGNIYVAYCITQPPLDAQVFPTRSIEIVRFHAAVPYPNVGVVGLRDWIQPLYVPGYLHTDPALLMDPVRNQIYVAFCISQTEYGPGRIVFACLSLTGSLVWFKNEDGYNRQVEGKRVQRPVLCLDSAGTLYSAVQTKELLPPNTTETVLFRIRPDTGDALWQSLNTLNPGEIPSVLTTYTPMSSLTTRYPDGVYNAGAVFSDPSLGSVGLSNLTLSVYRYPNEFHMLSFNPIQQYTYPTQGTIVISYP